MNRYPLNYRASWFNLGAMLRPNVAFRKPVYAGESSEVDVQLFYETNPTDRLRNPAVVSLYVFYVPHRLVWSGWTDFIADVDSGLTVPTNSTAWASMFENGGNTKSSLMRRGFKLCYNTFFGDETVGQTDGAWYNAIDADTFVNDMRMKSVSQVVQNLVSDLDNPADPFTGTVSGAVATIELSELDRRLRARRANVQQRMSGEKYTDALARFGVKVSDALIAQPEMIGFHSEVIYPTSTQATAGGTSPAIGTRWGKYAGTLKHKVGKKFFQEHGYVFGVFALRPVLSYESMGYPPEAFTTSREDFVIDPVLQPYQEVDRTAFSTSGDPDPILMRGWQYMYGQVMQTGGPSGVLTTNAQTINAMRYPAPLGGSSGDVDMTCHVKFKGATPLNGKVRA